MKLHIDDSGAKRAIVNLGKMHINFRAVANKSIRDSLIQNIIAEAQSRHERMDPELRKKVAAISAMMWKRYKMGLSNKLPKPRNEKRRYYDDTGELSRSLYIDNIRLRGSIMSYDILSNSPHAIYVEYGTEHASPYPFLRPTVDKNISKIISKLKIDTSKLRFDANQP